MTQKTCFVIMAISDQSNNGKVVSSIELKTKYNDLIKEALTKFDPSMEIVRADEVAMPGSITSDIIGRIIHSDIVIADISYPNPNVYYELALRHATRAGTIIIKDANSPKAPFDIANLRYIEYENSLSGLKDLAIKFEETLNFALAHPEKPDNQYLEFAKYTKYKAFDFSDHSQLDSNTEMMLALLGNSELFDLLSRAGQGEDVDQAELFRILARNPEASAPIIRAIVQSTANQQPERKTNRSSRRKSGGK